MNGGSCEWGPVGVSGTRLEPGSQDSPEAGHHSPSCQGAQGGQAPQKLQAGPVEIATAAGWNRLMSLDRDCIRRPLAQRQPPPNTTAAPAIACPSLRLLTCIVRPQRGKAGTHTEALGAS